MHISCAWGAQTKHTTNVIVYIHGIPYTYICVHYVHRDLHWTLPGVPHAMCDQPDTTPCNIDEVLIDS